MKRYDFFSSYDFSRLEIGDQVELRDFSRIIPQKGQGAEAGQWPLRPYRLLDGTKGNMIALNRLIDCGGNITEQIPHEITIQLPLEGWFRIYFLAPVCSDFPILDFPTGIDVALDEWEYIHVGPEYGTRKGRLLAQTDREFSCYYRTAYLCHSQLRLRIALGTYLSQPKGLIRAILSGIRFTRVETEEKPDPTAMPVVLINDGFSHYWLGGEPGNNIDTRIIESCRGSDVKKYLFQSPATGVTSWCSSITNYLGENIKFWDGKRFGDVRAARYIQWAIENQREAVRILPAKCHALGIQFHFSLRANLFFSDQDHYTSEAEKYFNGRFWEEHPELRLESSHGKEVKWDYRKKLVCGYVCALLRELIWKYDGIDGINLDLTRWPPVLPENCGSGLLVQVLREIDLVRKEYEKTHGKKLELSICAVEGYHAQASLEEQGIYLEEIMKAGVLDFLCIQSFEWEKIAALSQQYGISCYAIQEQTSPYTPDGAEGDPNWRLSDGGFQDDPVAGEELAPAPPVKSTLSPLEYQEKISRQYRQGADGICFINRFMGSLFLRYCGRRKKINRMAAWQMVCCQREEQYIFYETELPL